jgi:hypothetical protein
MKKKIFIGIAMSLFAVATVFNMNISEQGNAGDVSLDAIKTMAQARALHDLKKEGEWPDPQNCRFVKTRCGITNTESYCPLYACKADF